MEPRRRALSVLHESNTLPEPPRYCARKKTRLEVHAQFAIPHSQKPNKGDSNSFGECIYVDSDEISMANDQSEPMSLEKQLIQETAEIEMEDNFEDSIIGICKMTCKNLPMADDYAEEMLANYKKSENFVSVSPDYMTKQCDINQKMRGILIDWLIEVHDKFELTRETLFLTISLIDRFLSEQIVVRKKLQLVGLVAMLLACKYEDALIPAVADLLEISDNAYTSQEVLEMERLMLTTLRFNVSLPTPCHFVPSFLAAAQSDKKTEILAFYLIELSAVDYDMLVFPASLLAASAVYSAQCALHGFKQWNTACRWHSGFSEDQLQECSRKMAWLHHRAGTGKLTGAYRKYNTAKFSHISCNVPAACFLIH